MTSCSFDASQRFGRRKKRDGLGHSSFPHSAYLSAASPDLGDKVGSVNLPERPLWSGAFKAVNDRVGRIVLKKGGLEVGVGS